MAEKEQFQEAGIDYKQFQRLRDYSQLFEGIAGYTEGGYNLAAGNSADHLVGMPVSASYFPVLGVAPAVGRNFLQEEDQGEGQRDWLPGFLHWAIE